MTVCIDAGFMLSTVVMGGDLKEYSSSRMTVAYMRIDGGTSSLGYLMAV